jgi:hypothetical protein
MFEKFCNKYFALILIVFFFFGQLAIHYLSLGLENLIVFIGESLK